MRSPILTKPCPAIVNVAELPTDPIGNTYGAPLRELIIWQSDPLTATGNPPAKTLVWKMVVIIPLSGGPATPGESKTAQPILTAGLDIINSD